MSRRSSPVYFSDENDGWEQDRYIDDYGGHVKDSGRRRSPSRKHGHGHGTGSHRNRSGWDRYERS